MVYSKKNVFSILARIAKSWRLMHGIWEIVISISPPSNHVMYSIFDSCSLKVVFILSVIYLEYILRVWIKLRSKTENLILFEWIIIYYLPVWKVLNKISHISDNYVNRKLFVSFFLVIMLFVALYSGTICLFWLLMRLILWCNQLWCALTMSVPMYDIVHRWIRMKYKL